MARDQEVKVQACATMGLNQYPESYVIVSPICFISCKCEDRDVVIRLKLPHAASVQAPEYKRKVYILSTMSASSSRKSPNTPLFAPTDRKLAPLDIDCLEFDVAAVNFKLTLLYPALFAVGVLRGPIGVPRSIPIPLRCSLYILYKVHDGTGSLGRIFVHAYVALTLKTVDTVSPIKCRCKVFMGMGSSMLKVLISIGQGWSGVHTNVHDIVLVLWARVVRSAYECTRHCIKILWLNYLEIL